jgi:hypothetical protein
MPKTSPTYSVSLLALQPTTDPAVQEATTFVQALQAKWSTAGFNTSKAIFRNPVEPPVISDCTVHLDIPIGVYIPWSHTNILLLRSPDLLTNASAALRAHASRFTLVLARDAATAEAATALGYKPLLWSDATGQTDYLESFENQLGSSRSAWKALPPILTHEECPPISVVTLIYNRRKFLDLAAHNLMITDYPKDKIEWVIIEDSDDVNEQASDLVMKLARGAAPMSVSYIPCEKRKTIGEKRNEAILRAQNDIILMMDDDDHYPVTSFRRRVAWLLKHPQQPQAVACTTIACYDLLRGTSSVNIPPFTLSPAQRVSEATLTFRKSWWDQRKFPEDAKIAEGEGFLAGREADLLEIPPQQILVAMTHGKNASSRRAPASDAKPSCFWGFPKEFLIFLHRLAGVEIEEETAPTSQNSSRRALRDR